MLDVRVCPQAAGNAACRITDAVNKDASHFRIIHSLVPASGFPKEAIDPDCLGPKVRRARRLDRHLPQSSPYLDGYIRSKEKSVGMRFFLRPAGGFIESK